MQFHALRIVQPSGRVVFSFATTADILVHLTDIPRIGRGSDGDLLGYQRPQVASHIAEIRRYIDSEGSVLPNTVVVAFNDTVRFVPSNDPTDGPAQSGILHVPQPEKGEPRPGFVVDGQQRLSAIAGCRHEQFPFFVTALIAPDVSEQRKQFVLVNRTKPLPQGMIYELLPTIGGTLPQALARQRVAAQITEQLNMSEGSSLHRRIRTPTCPEGIIKDNSIRRAILNSLSDGALHTLHRTHRSDPNLDNRAVHLVNAFWKGVSDAFGEAWGLPPKKSRLTHGVGVVALGFVMDDLYARLQEGEEWSTDWVTTGLTPLVPHCAWTGGTWKFPSEERPWNALQNTDRDVRILAAYLRGILTHSTSER